MRQGPGQHLISLDQREAEVWCTHCGQGSHLYKAAVDWDNYDTQGYERSECVVWYRVERKHLDTCCREGHTHEAQVLPPMLCGEPHPRLSEYECDQLMGHTGTFHVGGEHDLREQWLQCTCSPWNGADISDHDGSGPCPACREAE